MELGLLKAYDFLCFKEVELDLQDQGLVLVDGLNKDLNCNNGAGKSSLFDVILYNLYGVTGKNLRADNVIRNGQKSCETHLKIFTEYGVIENERCRGKNGHRLWLDGKELGKGKDTQKVLEDLIKLDFKTFTSIAMVTQKASGFASNGDSAQKEILGKILNLERFNIAEDRANKSKQALVKEIENQKLLIKGLQDRLLDCKSRLESFEEQGQTWIYEKRGKLIYLEAELQKLQVKTDLNKLKLQEQILQEKIGAIDVEALRELIGRGEERIQDLTGKCRDLEYKRGSIKNADRSLLDVEGILREESICPSCGQPITSPESIAKRRAELEHINERTRSDTSMASKELQAISNELHVLEQKISAINEGTRDARIREREIHGLDQELTNLRTTLTTRLREEDLRQERIKTITNQFKEVEESTWPLQQAFDQEKEKQAKLRKELYEANGTLKDLEKELPYVSFWVNGFGRRGIPSFKLEKILPYLTEQANSYFSDISNGTGRIRFEATKELKSGATSETLQTIVSYANGGSSYGSISGGEVDRANFATVLSLGKLTSLRASIHVNFRLFDEPFQAAGIAGKQAMIKLLKNRILPEVGTIFLITQDSEMKSLFQKQITVLKENGISRVCV